MKSTAVYIAYNVDGDELSDTTSLKSDVQQKPVTCMKLLIPWLTLVRKLLITYGNLVNSDPRLSLAV